MRQPTRVVVLLSGSGTLLQALLEATDDPQYPAEVVAVGADRPRTVGEQRAVRRGIPTFVEASSDHPHREDWDRALTQRVAAFDPDLVVSAGFMKLLGPQFLARHRTINTHPALLPSFPGMHAVRDALAYGVTVTGCTCHWVDAGIDTGTIVAQRAVDVLPGDTEAVLHERIKQAERPMVVEVVRGLALGRLRRSVSTAAPGSTEPAE